MSRPTPLPARPLRPVATPALRGTICGVLAALWFGPLPGLAQDAPTAPPARDQRMVFHLDWGPAPLARIEMRIREDGPFVTLLPRRTPDHAGKEYHKVCL